MKNLIIFAAALALLSASPGCGLLRQARQEAANGAGGDGGGPPGAQQSLNVRIVRAGDESAFAPDPDADLGSPRVDDPVATDGDVLDFFNLVQLPKKDDPRGLFLVWPGQWNGSPITGATFEHGVVGENNQQASDSGSWPAKYDAARDRWSIPFQAFITADSPQVGPSFVQVITLHLVLGAQKPKDVTIRLRVLPPAPTLKVDDRFSSDVRLDEPAAGVIVKRSDLENPESRPVRVWIRSAGQDLLSLNVAVGLESWSQPDQGTTSLGAAPNCAGTIRIPIAAPRANPISWQRSVAPLRVSGVLVDRGGLPRTFLSTSAATPGALDLGPGEKATLFWVAFPVPHVNHCLLSTQGTRHFVWWNGNLPTPSPFCPLPDPYTASADHVDRWIRGGAALEGRWHGSVMATNVWEKAAPPGFSQAENTVGLSQGIDPRGLPAHDCQGLF